MFIFPPSFLKYIKIYLYIYIKMWLLLSLVRDSCSLCYLYVAETGLKLSYPASTSQVLGHQACAITVSTFPYPVHVGLRVHVTVISEHQSVFLHPLLPCPTSALKFCKMNSFCVYFFFLLKVFYFMLTSVFACVYVFVHHMNAVLTEARKGHEASWDWSYRWL